MLTRDLGARIARAAVAGTSHAARVAALPGVIDTIGTMLAGSAEPPPRTLCSGLAPLPPGQAWECVGGTRVDAASAALVNGMAAHVLDYDDVALRGHPSAVMVPAILALGQALGRNGRHALDAYVVGYQTWGDLVERERGMHPIKGWHTTSVFGAVGAAAACAALLRLDDVRAAHAIALGATQGAGLMANFGSMAKSYQTGRAAQAGVLAAKLAEAGMTAGADVFEHPQGFLRAHSPQGDVDTASPLSSTENESGWLVEQTPVSIKRYPTCYYTHRALDAILALLANTPVDIRDVEAVRVRISQEHATILRNHAPRTGLEAKFSMEFAMACALLHGKVGLTELTDACAGAPAMQDLMRRVRVETVVADSAEWHGAAAFDEVIVERDGVPPLRSDPVSHPAGHARRPLTPAQLDAKFRDCLDHSPYAAAGDALLSALHKLEDTPLTDFQPAR
ncbi:MmgE/PrpD family protein [Achromobacter aloeverae]|uniref:MmgE/PrpD family protein n=1 Tax=Achromobacter aloeverae TaxID=1750518 RepID=A0A4Q1HF94_9BURK|nr:MmgE/PrpD family protein [Achromobacter aloeverae]RXN85300.1 MmgE/PrpD family protein [Achromobacter aloeverae]